MKLNSSPARRLSGEGAANHQRGMETAGGRLYLTTRRPVFESHAFNNQSGSTVIASRGIVSAEPAWTRFLNLVSLMQNSIKLFVIAALLIVPSGASAQGERARRLVLSHDGFGPVKIGMTLSEASRALGVRVTRDAGYDGNDCYYATPKGDFKGIAFMMTGSRIVRIDVESGNFTTDTGAKIGDSEARVKSLYKGRYKVSRHKYFEAGRYIEVEVKGGRYSIIFETDGKRVTTYRVGRTEQVGYVERCS